MTATNTAGLAPDPREAALSRARTLYPHLTVAEQITVAEYLLRPAPAAAPVYPVAPFPAPWQITCGGSITNPADDRYVMVNAGSATPTGDARARALAAALDETPAIRWQPGSGAPAAMFLVRRDDDDGTAGVLARIG